MFFRQLVKTYCLVSLSLLFTTGIYAQSAPERINGIYASLAGDHAGLYVAQDLGLFRKYGLDVNLTYTAGADFAGTDSFTFQASDGQLDSNVATITVTVGNPKVYVALVMR